MRILLQILIANLILLGPSLAQPVLHQKNLTQLVSFRLNESSCDRESVIEDYQNDFIGTNVSTTELAWDGNVDACNEGKISELAMEKTLRRINYFRQLVGIESKVIFNEVKNEKAQKAVLMMDAENKLDHFPTADWKCSSPEGIEAAGKSNLSYGSHSSGSVPQYIRDAGSGNGAVGHRRWILYPKAHEFGFGSTNWGTAMWVIGGTKNPEVYPEFVAYPSPGYFPKNLIYPRWSFSKRGAKFESAKIRIFDENGNEIDYEREEVANGYGDHTLVWVPSINLHENSNGSDFYARVEIDSVKTGGEYQNFSYEVLGIVPEHLEDQFSMEMPTCSSSNGKIEIQIPSGYKSIEWSDGTSNRESIENLNAGVYSVTISDKIGCQRTMAFVLEDAEVAKELSGINGSQSSIGGQTESYSTEEYSNGKYTWKVTNGEIVSQGDGHIVDVVWDSGISEGMICTKFTDSNECESNEVCMDVALSTSSLTDTYYHKVQISPNPVVDILNLSLPSSKTSSYLQIFNARGLRVRELTLSANQNNLNLDLGSVSAGIYFLKVSGKKGSRILKFIKL